jgi:hypothetical protein
MAARDAAAAAVAELQDQVRRLPDFAAAEEERTRALAAAEEDDLVAVLLRGQVADFDERVETLRDDRDAATVRRRAAVAEEERHAPLAAKLPDVERGDGALAANAEQIAAAEEDERQAAAALAGAPTAPPPGPPVADLERAHRAAIRDVARLEEVVARERDAVAAAAREREDLLAAEAEHGDLTEVARVLDRNGLQAYEAAVVGEAIADDATDLLQRHGFDLVLRFDATRPTAAGKRYVEQARWTIHDQRTGKEYDARSRGGGASDGEALVAATAVFLAAAVGVARAGGGVPDATMLLDEAGQGAIRGELVERWAAMIRDGAARAGVRSVLLVPPNDQRLIDTCDGVITVEPSPSGSLVR